MERKKSLVLEIKEVEPQEEQNAFEYLVNFSQPTFHCENKINVLHLNTVYKKIVESPRGGKMQPVVLEKKCVNIRSIKHIQKCLHFLPFRFRWKEQNAKLDNPETNY